MKASIFLVIFSQTLLVWSASLHIALMWLPGKLGIHLNGSEQVFGIISLVMLLFTLVANTVLLRRRKPLLSLLFTIGVVLALQSLLAFSMLCQLAPYAARI